MFWDRFFKPRKPSQRANRRASAKKTRQIRFERLESRLMLSFDPSGNEQEVLFDLNRMRVNPQGELGVLFSSIIPLVARDSRSNQGVQQFNDPTSAEIQTDWPKLLPAQPLAWNVPLYNAATAHSQLMIQDDQQSHQLPGEAVFSTRDQSAGYNNWTALAENVYGYGSSAFNIHSAFAVDFGNASTNYGHRVNMMNASYREVGIAVVPDTRSGVQLGSLVTTEDMGNRSTLGNPWLVGVVYNDANHNGRYDAGEGLSGISVQVIGPGGPYTTTTATAGGYQIQVPAGSYQVTASGGSLSRTSSVPVSVQNSNVEADFISGTSTGYVNFVLATKSNMLAVSTFNGNWTPAAQGLYGSAQVSSSSVGSGISSAIWTTTVLPGLYDLAATWTPGNNLSQTAIYAVYDANYTQLGYGVVNQQTTPNQFTDQNAGWARLGTFKVTTGNVLHVITWNSRPDGQINADALRIAPVAATIVNNGDQGSSAFSNAGGWTVAAVGFDGGSLVSNSTLGSGTSSAAWTTVVQTGLYDVAVTWTPGANFSQSAIYAVYDANYTQLGYGVVNQQTAPSQFTDQGVSWARLGTFSVTAGNLLRIITWNSRPDGQISADAVRIVPVTAITVNDGDRGSSSFATGGGWAAVAQGLYGGSLVSNTAIGNGTSSAIWTTTVPTGSYDVAVTWTPGNTLSQSAIYAVYDANYTLLGYGVVNQRSTPGDFTDQGVGWAKLGTFKVTAGTVLRIITWNSRPDGQISADAVRVAPAAG